MTEHDPLQIVGVTIDGKYEVEGLVGEGGFAHVYRAKHNVWNKPVAIKLFSGLSSAPPNEREALKQQFINEGALLTELSTQNACIVQARDVGDCTTPAGQWMPYMVLEWLDGQSLEDLLEQERKQQLPPWSFSQIFALLTPAAEALAVVHDRGIAHRDVKPPNFFVCGQNPRTERTTVKLLDFGVAKMMSDNTHLQAALAKTGTNITSFTPQYGAPEQFTRTYGATGPWTDVFALALLMIEMATGRPALTGDDLVQLGFASGNPTERPTPRNRGLTASDELEAVFTKALAVSPTHRYQNVREFWQALSEVVEHVSTPGSLSLKPPVQSKTDPTARTMLQTDPPPVQATTVLTGSVTSPDAPPKKSGGGAVIAAAVGVLVVGGGAAAYFLSQRGGDHTAAASAPTSTDSAATPSAGTSAAAPPPATCPEDMVKVPAGQFFMGSEREDASDNQKPVHNVKLDAFCIDLTEVTVKAYKTCSDVGKCRRAPNDNEWPDIKKSDNRIYDPLCNVNAADERADHPINCVTWTHANTYCTANGKQLPTEAQWEYATRGPDGRVYPWGDDDPTHKHLNACGPECEKWGRDNGVPLAKLYEEDDGFPTTAPVGKFEAGKSRFGPYDVVGNVWEWVADWHAPYTAEARENPTGPKTGDKRVIRGGAWNGSYKQWLHPSFRYMQVPDARSYGIGFRCAKSL